MKKLTNHMPGPRGINLVGGDTRWLEPGETAEIDEKTIAGAIPDLGKAPDAAAADGPDPRIALLEAENLRLTARVTELEAQVDAGNEPGPLDQSVEKLTAHLETVTDADEVERLLVAEKAGKSRTGAVAALEARRDALLA